ncbi:MAG: anaerobic ribonucleoside-triphosphate reductase activating protein [Chlamydiota bacterium]
MKIGGIQHCSLIDFPGKLAAVIFTEGCPFRCHYCHNPSLVLPSETQKRVEEREVFSFLEKRVGKLDGVVISGGEPTLQEDLIPFIEKIRNMGFCIKLDTSGFFFSVLQELLEKKLVDYVAMDIKAPLDKYAQVIGREVDTKTIQESICLLLQSSISYEFRTTLVGSLHTKEDVVAIAKTIQGAPLYVLQRFFKNITLNPHFQNEDFFSEQIANQYKILVEPYVKECRVR